MTDKLTPQTILNESVQSGNSQAQLLPAKEVLLINTSLLIKGAHLLSFQVIDGNLTVGLIKERVEKMFGMPGGKSEEGESIWETLVRELGEEMPNNPTLDFIMKAKKSRPADLISESECGQFKCHVFITTQRISGLTYFILSDLGFEVEPYVRRVLRHFAESIILKLTTTHSPKTIKPAVVPGRVTYSCRSALTNLMSTGVTQNTNSVIKTVTNIGGYLLRAILDIDIVPEITGQVRWAVWIDRTPAAVGFPVGMSSSEITMGFLFTTNEHLILAGGTARWDSLTGATTINKRIEHDVSNFPFNIGDAYYLHFATSSSSWSGAGNVICDVNFTAFTTNSCEVTNIVLTSSTITGTVPVAVQNFPSTQDVVVQNFPAVQPISGTVSTIITDVDIPDQSTDFQVVVSSPEFATPDMFHIVKVKYDHTGKEPNDTAIKSLPSNPFDLLKLLESSVRSGSNDIFPSDARPSDVNREIALKWHNNIFLVLLELPDTCIFFKDNADKVRDHPNPDVSAKSPKQKGIVQTIKANRQALKAAEDIALSNVPVSPVLQTEQSKIKETVRVDTPEFAIKRRQQRRIVITRITNSGHGVFAFCDWLISQLSLLREIENDFVIDVIASYNMSEKMKNILIKGITNSDSSADIRSLLSSLVLEYGCKDEENLQAYHEYRDELRSNGAVCFVFPHWTGNVLQDGDIELNPGEALIVPVLAALTAELGEKVVTDVIPGLVNSIGDTISPSNPVGYDGIIQSALTPVEQMIGERGKVEAEILRAMEEQAGFKLTRSQADKMLRNNSRDSNVFDGLINKITTTLGDNKYIGPNYSGGTLASSQTLRDLAERFAVTPTSNADAIARQHDLAYAVAKDKNAMLAADATMIEQLNAINDKSVLDHVTLGAMRAKSGFDSLASLFGRPPQKKDLTTEGIEPNPGPVDIVKLLNAVLEVLNREKVWSGKTLHSIDPPQHMGPGNILSSDVHDGYFINRGRRREKTNNSIAVTIDGLINFFSSYPLNLWLPGANSAALVPTCSVVARMMMGGAGPRLVSGPLATAFDQALEANSAKDLIKALGVNTALANGSVNYVLWRETAGDPLLGNHNPAGGSNAMILATIYMYTMLFCTNARYCPIHNMIRGNMVKPDQTGPVVAPLFPNNPGAAITGMHLWAMNLTDVTEYFAGNIPAGAPIGGFAVPPHIIYCTSDMIGNGFTTELVLWILAHLPWVAAKPTEFVTVKGNQTAGFNAGVQRGAASVLGQSFTQLEPNGTIIDVVVVLLDINTRLGTLGQANPNFDYDYGISNVAHAINNPMTAAGVPVQGQVDTLAQLNVMRQADMTAISSTVTKWWTQMYGSKQDRKMAVFLATLFSSSFLPVPQVSLSSGYAAGHNAITGALTTDANSGYDMAQGTTARIQAIYDTTQDMFGQAMKRPAETTPTYFISQMTPVRRAALALGVREVAPDDKLAYRATTEVNPVSMFAHILEMGEAWATYHDTLRDKAAMPEDFFNGIFIGSTTVNRSLTFHETQVKSALEHIGCAGFMYTRSSLGTVNNNSSAYSMQRLTFDKLWEGTEFYACKSTDIYRKNCPDLSIASFTSQNFGLVVTNANYLAMPSKSRIDDSFSDWLQPNIAYTQAITASRLGYDVNMYEQDTLISYPMFCMQIMDTAERWLNNYIGTTAVFNASDPTPSLGEQYWTTDYTIQPKYGPKYGRPIHVTLNGLAQTTYGSPDVPFGEAYRSVSTPLASFNAPTVNGDVPEFNAIMDTLMGAKTSTV
jgi:hypothetical protein